MNELMNRRSRPQVRSARVSGSSAFVAAPPSGRPGPSSAGRLGPAMVPLYVIRQPYLAKRLYE